MRPLNPLLPIYFDYVAFLLRKYEREEDFETIQLSEKNT